MTAPQQPPEGDAARALDALRRRLYRADATDADVERYVAEFRAIPHEDPAEPTAVERRPRRRAVAGALVFVAATAAALVLLHPSAPGVAPAASVAETPRAVLQQVGDGQVLDVAEGSVADLAPVATSVEGVAVVGGRFAGSGDALVAVGEATRPTGGGSASVVLTTSGGRATWRALLMTTRTGSSTRTDSSTQPVVMAQGASGTTAADATTTFAYPGLPPSLIAVRAPAGTRWTLVLGVTGGLAPQLR